MTIYSTRETIDQAIHTFFLDRDGQPELIPIGLRPLDDELGGLGPKSCAILAAATGVGKSSAMLSAMLSSTVTVGCVSLEDGPDVVGTRLISALTHIDSLRIRRKNLSDEELERINDLSHSRRLSNLQFAYPIAGTIDDVEESVKQLCNAGCRMVWLDYLQKVRGHREERRHEVAETFTRFQRAVARGNAAGVAISQIRRIADGERIPQISHLKESGDLENEARVILLAHRVRDPDHKDRVRFRVAKSTYGGEYIKFDMTRDESGTLVGAKYLDHAEGL